jgi:hypothetical protein
MAFDGVGQGGIVDAPGRPGPGSENYNLMSL